VTGENDYVRSYEDLRVWQEGMLLAEQVYELCKQLPKEEVYGLTSQMKRSSVSVPSNIAEGSERNGTKELIQFLYIARGSLAELQTQLMLCVKLKLIANCDPQLQLSRKISRGLVGLIKSLQGSKPPVTGHLFPPVTEESNA
jgi:four helix bundle protein